MTDLILQPGTRFVSFDVDRLIGSGGMGQVFRVTHRGEPFALKVIRAGWADGELLQKILTTEGQVLAWLNHPYIVKVHDMGIHNKTAWIRMELLDGMTLREMLHVRPPSIAVACRYLRMIGMALHQAHLYGIIHRDLKPENVFITRAKEIAKLLDFGIVKLSGGVETKDGQRKGTPLYMAPEQIRGGKITAATDVYAMGVLAHEMLDRGKHPF